ncbi:dienelactone hydrolase family protein [Actinokineospora sp. UTMC 2448]|uniref:dienelactone hydrolase family protein n=1 Tax=Actinokineospora sp. UTMC 2448 TaxID=2268449 RepID=UPI0021640B28|nr:alpha/beta fold hydrolase [Actinokineospora sp. UTMC 2448]
MREVAVFIDEEVRIPVDRVGLPAHVALPRRTSGAIVFAHGSGSSRHSPRNQRVAAALRDAGHGTVLTDLLTPEEEDLRFDIPLLASRLAGVVDWLADRLPDTPIGLFGASTGAAAALVTAAERPAAVRAVVSRGGRPDLAGDALGRVLAPTLLIVGSLDHPVIPLNRQAAEHIRAMARVEIVAGATHLFEEPGTLDRVAALAAEWFTTNVGTAPAQPYPS